MKLHAVATLTLLVSCSAIAQPAIDWSTIDCGGGPTSGGSLDLICTLGQHDAVGAVSGGTLTLTGGFWIETDMPCLADFNHDSSVDFFDYLDFVAAFSSGANEADFNQDSTIDFFDYLDFVAAFSTPC